MKQKERNKKESSYLKVIPLGGVGEIGKNMTLLEYQDQILIIDCGMSFPDDEMYGIDVVLPDFSYLEDTSKKIKGLILTHGHEDHIGAIPYFLRQFNVPIYGTRLTLGLVENKLEEHEVSATLNIIKPGTKFNLGPFKVETIRTTHSVADAVCYCIDTPVGKVFHTGDFKIDYTPVDGEPINLHKFAELGEKGVLLMMADSTNALRPGYTASERVVGETLDNIFQSTEQRIIIATFSSNVHRLQKIIDNAVKCGRKVAISGRSMENVVRIATELGYLKVPSGTIIDLEKARSYPDKKLVIITTGSQGEPMAALSRMATNDHKSVQIKKGDVVILSSTPVPGNEKTVGNVVNKLIDKGAKVIYSDIAETHVSGHARQEELKLIHNLIRPTYFMPVHGEAIQLLAHKQLAESLGMNEKKIYILDNGDALNVSKKKAFIEENKVHAGSIFVDGLGVGDVGNIVLRDRRLLSESGLIIVVAAIESGTGEVVSGPDLISRGFVYVRENEDLMTEAKEIAESALEYCNEKNIRDWNAMKNLVRDDLRRFIYDKTERNPVILPLFLEV